MRNLNPIYEFVNPGEKRGTLARKAKAFLLKNARKGWDMIPITAANMGAIASMGLPAWTALPGTVPLMAANVAGPIERAVTAALPNTREAIRTTYNSVADPLAKKYHEITEPIANAYDKDVSKILNAAKEKGIISDPSTETPKQWLARKGMGIADSTIRNVAKIPEATDFVISSASPQFRARKIWAPLLHKDKRDGIVSGGQKDISKIISKPIKDSQLGLAKIQKQVADIYNKKK